MSPKNKVIEIVSVNPDPRFGFFDDSEHKKSVHMFLVIQRMVKKFIKTKTLNEKLIINNIIILLNTFGVEKVNLIFYSILDKEHEFGVIKSFLQFLKCYKIKDSVGSNRIVDDILLDIKHRYNLEVD